MNASLPILSRTSFRRPGFSLLELATVLVIIAVLVSLVLPVAGDVRKQARSVNCASNLRQLHGASTSWTVAKRPAKLSATGWMQQLLPHIGDQRTYQCPESTLVMEKLDAAGAWDSAVVAPTPTPAAPKPAPPGRSPPPLENAFVTIDSYGGTWDVPVKEGPWFRKSNVTENSYDLWLEDAGFQGGGDQDFLDVGLRVTDRGDGLTVIELLARPPGKLSFYNSALNATTASGATKSMLTDLYKNGAKPGALAVFLTPAEDESSSSGSGSNSSGGSSLVSSFRAGSGAPADYGFTARAEQVFGLQGKIFAIDYVWSVADPDTDNWSQEQWQTGDGVHLTIGRHRGGANILYGDGSVSLEPVGGATMNPGFADNKARFWDK